LGYGKFELAGIELSRIIGVILNIVIQRKDIEKFLRSLT